MIRYALFTLLLLISISIFSQPIYNRLELDASPYYTYFYDLNGDNKKDAIEFSDEINIFYQEENVFPVSPLKIQYPVKNFIFDFVNLEKGSGCDLIFFKEDGIYKFKKVNKVLTNGIEKLIDTASIYIESDNRGKKFADISFDLNNDGIDEIFIPRLDTPLLFKKNGEEFKNVDLPVIPLNFSQNYFGMNFKSLEEVNDPDNLYFSYESIYSSPNFLIQDFNNDGLKDLGEIVAYNSPQSLSSSDINSEDTQTQLSSVNRYYKKGSIINIYLQKENLKFPDNPDYRLNVPTPTPFWGVHFSGFDSQTLVDLNNDNFPDLIVRHTEDNIFNPKTTYKIYLGDKKEGFKKDFSQVLTTKDILGEYFISDINSDGLVDISLLYIDVNFSSTEIMARIILGREVEIEIRTYLGKKGKLFNEKPDIKKRLVISSRCFNWWYLPNFIVNYDFDGDGKLDLLVREAVDKAFVYKFINEEKGFSNTPILVFNLTEDSELDLDYLNNDKKADVIEKVRGKRLRIYLSR